MTENATIENDTTEKELISLENINAMELFTEDGIDPILKAIEKKVADFVPDLETAKGRTECASMAYKVSKSKVVIINAGKGLTAEWKAKSKLVDSSIRKATIFCDALRDRVREPLTEWEAEQERIAAEKKARDELEYLHGEAIAEDFIFEREREIKRKEAEFEAKENERREREEQERAERERVEREEQEKQAQIEEQEREEKARVEREERERKDRERIEREAQEKAKRDADEAIRVAEENAERDRESAEKAQQYLKDQAERAEREAKEAAEKAERERLEAIEQTKREAARAEREREAQRIDKQHREQRERERKAADVEHRRTINNAILDALDAEGIGDRTAKKIVTLIATGTIPHVSINY